MSEGALLASLKPALVLRWAADPELPSARTVTGTVVSADISGFTRLAEHLADDGPRVAAETLNRTINRCFEPMIDEVLARGGDVLKFGGDAIFVLFEASAGSAPGIPTAVEPAEHIDPVEPVEQRAPEVARPGADHAIQAAVAANRLQELLAEVDLGIDTELSMTVGVATGPVELVLAGTDRRELVVHGPTVDECLRLEGEAEPGEVLVSAATAGSIPSSWVDTDDPDVLVLVGPGAGEAPPAPTQATTAGGTGKAGRASKAAGSETELDVDAVTRVVGPDLAAATGAFAGALGEVRMVAVAFVDLPTADLDPATVEATVRRSDEISRRHGVTLLGTDVTTGGTKLFLAAGAPTAGDADVDALLGALTELVLDPGSPPMRAGVNRGLVYAGFLGSDRRRTFTVMGDPTNLAARLQSKAEPGTIAVSQPVLDGARGRYPTGELSPILVRGRLAPVTVHRLLGQAVELRSSPVDPEFVGRNDELARLRGALDEARRGQGAAIGLVGESGVGASRLIAEVADDLPVGVLRLDLIRRLAGPAPYAAVAPALRALAAVDGDGRDGVDALAQWLERVAPDVVPWLPLVAPAFGIDAEDTEATAAISDEFRQARAIEELATALGSTLTGPTGLVAEDLHHADPASLALCQAIADRCPEQPWLLLTSTRPDRPGIAGGETLTLGPLPIDAARTLVDELGDLPAARQQALAELSGGNPRFAIELVQADRAAPGGSGPTAGSSSADLHSIEALITGRIDRLGHEPRLLLRTAAVLGRRFSLPLLRSVLAGDGAGPDLIDGLSTFPNRLDRLVDDEGDGWYTFRSGVIHQVAYDGLSTERRRQLHRLVAELLGREEADPGELAWHHEQAGNDHRCWDISHRAAERARELGLMAEVARHLTRAVAAGERAGPSVVDESAITDAMVELFGALVAAGEEAEAVAVGQRVVDRLEPSVDRARFAFRYAYVRGEHDGSFEAGIDWLVDELERLDAAPFDDERRRSEARAWVAAGLASLHWRNASADRALAAADRAIADANAAGEPGPEAPALLTRHVVLADRVSPEREAAAEELIDVATAAGDTRVLISGHNNIGLDLQDGGRWDEAIRHYERGMQLADRIGDDQRRRYLAVNRAVLLGDQGRWDEARPLLDELRRQASYGGGGVVVAWIELELGRLEVHAGRIEDGRRWLSSAADRFAVAGSRTDHYEMALLWMAADLGDGRSGDVLDGADRLEPIDDVPPRLLGRPALLRGYALLQQARPDEAADELATAVAETDGVYLFGHARALVGRAEAEDDLGRGRSARRTRGEAQEVLGRLGVEALPVIPLPR
ncbi:MAG: adenylate/guanylate cyclase domain-containing protein [Actinomycetota bacterium]